jgi:hypothetical protein
VKPDPPHPEKPLEQKQSTGGLRAFFIIWIGQLVSFFGVLSVLIPLAALANRSTRRVELDLPDYEGRQEEG